MTQFTSMTSSFLEHTATQPTKCRFLQKKITKHFYDLTCDDFSELYLMNKISIQSFWFESIRFWEQLVLMTLIGNFNLWQKFLKFLKSSLIFVDSSPIKKSLTAWNYFSKNTYSVGCAILCFKSEVMLSNHA